MTEERDAVGRMLRHCGRDGGPRRAEARPGRRTRRLRPAHGRSAGRRPASWCATPTPARGGRPRPAAPEEREA